MFNGAFAGVPGLEPRLTEPESVGLPITPYPIALIVREKRKPIHEGIDSTLPSRSSMSWRAKSTQSASVFRRGLTTRQNP